MAPVKGGRPSALAAIRKTVAHQHHLSQTVRPGSAYAKLNNNNITSKYGRRERDEYEEDEEDEAPVRGPIRKKGKKHMLRRAAKTETKPEEKPAPVVEAWRPAGGEALAVQYGDDEPTARLGLARLTAFRLGVFNEAVKQLIEQHGEPEEIVVKEFEHCGEVLADVYAVFNSPLVAQTVRKSINGEVVVGRKIQVEYS